MLQDNCCYEGTQKAIHAVEYGRPHHEMNLLLVFLLAPCLRHISPKCRVQLPDVRKQQLAFKCLL